jgi:glyoxylase-like metal-dependent hydrolase (beta-lactamase superfamily II)
MPLLLLFVMLATQLHADNSHCDFKKITERVYVIIGSDHEACPAKEVEHPVTNPAVIVGETGVIIIDPGSSLPVGNLVVDRLESITDKPVLAVFNSHIHGLYWLGNQAIQKRFPDARFYAHHKMIERVESGEGAFWVEAITGKYQGEKTDYLSPTVPLVGNETLEIAGVTLKIHHTGHAHTDHDIMLEIPDERTLFLGGMVVEPEVPSQGVPEDANFLGQIAATEYALTIAAEHYIPGRGDVGDIELPRRALKFLQALYSGVEHYYEEGLADYEITSRLNREQSDFAEWYDFTQLGGVVSQMYLQIQNANF